MFLASISAAAPKKQFTTFHLHRIMAFRLLARPASIAASSMFRTAAVSAARPSVLGMRFMSSTPSLESLKAQVVPNATGEAMHWAVERNVTKVMVPALVGGIFFDNMLLDLVIVSTVVPHCYWGMQQVLIDYLHPRKFGSLGQAANMTLIVFTVLGALGLVKLAFGDGVTRAVKVLLHK